MTAAWLTHAGWQVGKARSTSAVLCLVYLFHIFTFYPRVCGLCWCSRRGRHLCESRVWEAVVWFTMAWQRIVPVCLLLVFASQRLSALSDTNPSPNFSCGQVRELFEGKIGSPASLLSNPEHGKLSVYKVFFFKENVGRSKNIVRHLYALNQKESLAPIY